jgi:hypothetical protein
MWPGNTADVTTLVPVIDRLRQRFAIGKVCVVADRGMISAETIAHLEARGLEYILGERERSSKEVRQIVLNDAKPSVPLTIPRGSRPDTELEAKEVRVGARRYVVCRNLNEARRDALLRENVLNSLRTSLRSGDKSLVGNSAYRRYLKTPDQTHFEIDEQRVAEDARYDGLYVLRTNTSLDPLAVMLRYRELLKVDIDQAWRLSRLNGGGRGRCLRRRSAPPRYRRGADRPDRCDCRIIGMHQCKVAVTDWDHAAA